MSNNKHIIFRITDARSRRFQGTPASKTNFWHKKMLFKIMAVNVRISKSDCCEEVI